MSTKKPLEKEKFGSNKKELTTNGLRNFRKKFDSKNHKNSKYQCEISTWEQKPLARKRILQTPLSRSTLKLE